MRFSPEGAVRYDSPIRLYDHDGRKISDKVKKMLPLVYPLFRAIDNQMTNVAPYARVVPYGAVYRWYALLLGEVERRLEEKHRLPRRLVEWETREDGTRVVLRALVDIHTLRATGITSLHDRGVPIDVIAQFVSGHLTVLMALYYVNRAPIKVRELMMRMSSRFTENSYGTDGLPQFLSEDAATDLLSNPAFDQSRSETVIQAAIRTNIHHLTDGASGLCPGALCSEGGLDAKGNPMMVRGGSGSCGNCRFWRTSYLFLNGQVVRLNEIAYECHVLAKEIIDQRKHVRKVGALVEQDPSNHRNKVLLHQHESKLKGLEECLDDKLYDYGGRYELFTRSKQQYVEMTKLDDAAEPEIGGSLSETSPYIHAHWLSLQAEVAPELGVCSRAIVDLENAIMRLCDVNELPNFLVRLDKDARIRASNAFMEALSETDAMANANPEFINSLFEGRVLLRMVGLHDAARTAIMGAMAPRLVADLSTATEGDLVNG